MAAGRLRSAKIAGSNFRRRPIAQRRPSRGENAMYQSPLIQDLHDRGLIDQITDAAARDKLLTEE